MKLMHASLALILLPFMASSLAAEETTIIRDFSLVHSKHASKRLVSALHLAGGLRTGTTDKDCTHSSDQPDDKKVCQIDLVVEFDDQNMGAPCVVDLTTTVHVAKRKTVQWNIVQADTSNYKITFARFPSIKPILLVDGRSLGDDTDLSDTQYRLRPKGPTAARGVYYFIFLAWADVNDSTHSGICQVIDPVIAND